MTDVPLGPLDSWSVSTLLFAGLSGLLSAVLYLYRGREVEHTEQIKDLKAATIELKTNVKDLQIRAETCHEDRVKMSFEIGELRNQIQRLTGGS